MPQRREASSRPNGDTSSAAASASLTPVAHRMQQAVLGRLSDLRASRHAGRMQTSAVGSHEHACTSTAGVVAHCAAVPQVSIPWGTVSISTLLFGRWRVVLRCRPLSWRPWRRPRYGCPSHRGRCPSHRGRCPSRPAGARRQRLLSNAWVFFDRTKSVADCETRARWPGRAARATPERERAHRSFVY